MYTKIGDKQFETKNTTPESLILQKYFDQMVNERIDSVLMEVSSHALHEGRVHGCDFDIAVFTNLTQDHLDYHGSMEAYLHAKGLLFAQLGNTYRGKTAVLNQDDPASKELKKMTCADIITYGIFNKADVYATDVKVIPTGTEFTLHLGEEKERVAISLIGQFSVYNVLAAAAAAYAANVPFAVIKQSIEQVKGVAGRFEAVHAGQDFTVIVDYAHTNDSLDNVLETVNQFAEKEVTAIIGCGGDRDRTKRPLMAKVASTKATKAIFTADNPRSEDPAEIVADMVEGLDADNYEIILERETAIRTAVNAAEPGDVIVIAGKGHETYQIFHDRTIDFDDREVARQAIKERLASC